MDKYFKLSSSRYHIRYTPKFKNHVCKLYLSGKWTKVELQKRFGIKGNGRIIQWLRNYPYLDSETKEQILKNTASQSLSKKQLEAQVKKLERQLAESRLKEAAYRSMIEIAEEEFNIQIKKK